MVGDETVVYDVETKEAHCLNPLAAMVFQLADGKSTTADIAELAAYRLGKPVTEPEVAEAVGQLESHALLQTPLMVRDGLSRREAMQRMATVAGAAAATPLIASVMAPAASAAGSLIPTGGCCGNTHANPPDTCTGGNPTCESNHCCQNVSSKDCNQCKCVGDKNDCTTTQCSDLSPTGCPNMVINGVSTPACGKTSSGKCCYPDVNGNCCTVFTSGTGTVINC